MPQLRLRLYGRRLGCQPEAGMPLPVSWESAFEHLERLPRMYAEPDGSFLWSGQESATDSWQLEGTVFDDGRCVRRVELLGNCTPANWSRLLICFECNWDSISIEDLDENQVVDGHWLRSMALKPAAAANTPAPAPAGESIDELNGE